MRRTARTEISARLMASTTAGVEVAIGLTAEYLAVSGKPFVTGGPATWDYSRRDANNIQTFQRTPEIRAHFGPDNSPAMEHWEGLDESATGFRLRRCDPGARIAHRQLLAVRPGGASQFILAEVRWLMQESESSTTLGTCALPGLARACAVRSASSDPARQTPFSQAFVLPVTLDLPPSLVIPAGWFGLGRLLDLRLDDGIVRIRLLELLDRGFDYDRVNFTAAT